jgi:hypothetical protein
MDPIFTDRETARLKLALKADSQRRLAAQIEAEKHLPAGCRRTFVTISPVYLAEDAEFRLRWIDCAPEGANHLLAPLQGKDGVPMSGVSYEAVGPGPALREARLKHGRHPLSGLPL